MTQPQWLVRTHQNRILRPMSREELISRIKARELHLQDEICQGNSYWIFLHEREEVKRQLGIDLPRIPGHGDDEEITETEVITQQESRKDIIAAEIAAVESSLETPENTAVLQMPSAVSKTAPASSSVSAKANHPGASLASPRVENTISTRVIPVQKIQDAAKQGRNLPPVIPPPQVIGEIERASAWKLLLWGLLVAIVAVAYLVLRSLAVF